MTDEPRYRLGVALFQDQHWFEAHEILELAWRAEPAGPTKRYLQGLIQLAVCLEHWRRGNPRGARGQLDKGRAKMEGLPDVYAELDLRGLLDAFERWEVACRPNFGFWRASGPPERQDAEYRRLCAVEAVARRPGPAATGGGTRHHGVRHLLERARRYQGMLDRGEARSTEEIGRAEGITGRRVAHLLVLLTQ